MWVDEAVYFTLDGFDLLFGGGYDSGFVPDHWEHLGFCDLDSGEHLGVTPCKFPEVTLDVETCFVPVQGDHGFYVMGQGYAQDPYLVHLYGF